MKIAGIAGAKHPTLKKGEPIPLSPEDKICAMAKEILAGNSPEGFKNIPLSAEVIGKVDIIMGRNIRGKEDPEQYKGKARVKFRRTRLKDDRIFPSEECVITVHCKNCKDDIGTPDLEVVDFKIQAPKTK